VPFVRRLPGEAVLLSAGPPAAGADRRGRNPKRIQDRRSSPPDHDRQRHRGSGTRVLPTTRCRGPYRSGNRTATSEEAIQSGVAARSRLGTADVPGSASWPLPTTYGLTRAGPPEAARAGAASRHGGTGGRHEPAETLRSPDFVPS
jgi:hypothetical protein